MNVTLCGKNCAGTILYIGGFELPDKNAAAQRVLANAKLFRAIGYNTVFVGINKEIEYKIELDLTKKVYDDFVMYSVPYPKNMWQWINYLTNPEPYIFMAQKIKDLKVIICYNFPSINLEKIRRYCKRNNIKCIADVTEWYSGLGRLVPVKVLKGMDTFYRMCIVQKKLDGLIVISRYLENYYRSCYNVAYIPPLTDFDIKDNKKDASSDTLTLVYAGSPGLKDKINLLIEAVSNVKRKVALHIIGISEKDYLKLYPEHLNQISSNPNVIFHGRLSHDETIRFVRNADFSCFFRGEDRVTKAGFPTKFAEAISLGTPVITNKSSNVDEYIGKGKNGILIEKLTVSEIARAIEEASLPYSVEMNTFNYLLYKKEAKSLFSFFAK